MSISVTAIDVRDFQRLKLFRAKFNKESGLILIGGRNGQGKSSLLDAFLLALNPNTLKSIKQPVRNGADEAQIALTVGPWRIVRRISADGKTTSGLAIFRDGIPQSRPTDILKDLIGELFVDPVEWMTAQPIKQREILARQVGLDFSAIDSELATSNERKKFLGERQDKLKHQAEDLEWFPDAPAEPVSVSEISGRLTAAIQHNGSIDNAKQTAESVAREAEQAKTAVFNAQFEIERLERLLAEAQTAKEEKQQVALDLADRAENLRTVAAEMIAIDTQTIQEELAGVEETNRQVQANVSKAKAKEEWIAAEEQLGECVELIRSLNAQKKDMLSKAKFPVEGLSFDESQVMFNNAPLSQAGDAEKIRVAVGVSLAMRGQCAALIVRAGNDLDNNSILLLADAAEKHGAQIFVEMVANPTENGGYDKECDFYIEEGELVGAKSQEVA